MENEEKKLNNASTVPRSKRAQMLKEGTIAQLNIDVQPGTKSNMEVIAAVKGKKLSAVCEIALIEYIERQKEETGSERSSVWQSVTLPRCTPTSQGLKFQFVIGNKSASHPASHGMARNLSHFGDSEQKQYRKPSNRKEPKRVSNSRSDSSKGASEQEPTLHTVA